MSLLMSHLGFEWPNGDRIFHDICFTFTDKTYGLVGPNGIGKTTLARLMIGELLPTTGSMRGEAVYFRQAEARPALSVAEYIGEINGLAARTLGGVSVDRTCASLSGGEWTRVRLAKVASVNASFVILDEPTNHLDQEGRNSVYEFLRNFPGGRLVISHDRELLESVDEILELIDLKLTTFGGGWADYESARTQARARLKSQLDGAKRKRDASQRARQQKLSKQAKRQKQGERDAPDSGLSRLLIGMRKRNAQVTAGQIDRDTSTAVDEAVSSAWEAYQNLKVDPVMYAQLPAPSVPRGKLVFQAHDYNFRFSNEHADLFREDLNFAFSGPARVALTGGNGTGKSTLLRLLRGEGRSGASRGILKLGAIDTFMVDQEYASLKADASVIECVRENASLSEAEVRGHLAMFLFKGVKVQQKLAELSGGEKLRVALAKAMLSERPAQLLILDEPTNNLDMPNIEFLEDLLRQYKGALLVVSHDSKFLEKLNLKDEIQL